MRGDGEEDDDDDEVDDAVDVETFNSSDVANRWSSTVALVIVASVLIG